ncbi:MAG TPA: ATP-binding cassette domain-containing protein, partial [Thermoanaerobaculia bacterium]|nr:ATP-binding cassette domain-containing protein [Thermoanaerobaculia bacterium]
TGDPACPDRQDCLSSTIEALFTPRTRVVVGRVSRELGRFVLPVTVHVPGYGAEKLGRRVEIDRVVSTMTLPAGTVIERPSLSRWSFSAAKLRLLGLAAFLPLLLLAAATVVLNSFGRAVVAVAPALLGVSFAAPVLLLTRSEVDEITLVGLAGAVCCVVPMAAIAIVRAAASTHATYRAVRRDAVPLLFAALAIAVMLGAAAGGGEALRSGWRAPMVATAAVLVVATACGALLPGALLFVARDVRRRVRVGKAIAHPAEWRSSDVPNTLVVRNLSKTYAGGFRALRQVSFELTPGVIGLLGPNGAGKTTLLRTLTGLLLPTRGQIVFRGVPVTPENLADYRRFVGFLPQEFNAYSGLTAAQFLDYWMVERGMNDPAERARETERLLALVDLTEHANRRVRDYSGGMRQRIGIARALIGDPPLLVVDEPTTGLDIEARARFRDLMQTLGKDRVVILSTHIAGDVESTAARILLIVKGVLRWDGTPETLITRALGRVFETIVSDADARTLSRRYRITTRVRTPQGIRLRGVVREGEPLPGTMVEATLEEAYLAEATEGEVKLGSFSFLTEP